MNCLADRPLQRDAIAAALKLYRKRPFAVADIGSQSAWLRAASHDPRNLYVSGPMGLASSVALGLAVSRPDDEVLAVCGDGALAMNFSSLITIAGARTKNLSVLVLANRIYEYTSSLPVPSEDLDWLACGRAIFGAESCFVLDDLTEANWAATKRPAMIVAEIAPSIENTPPLGLSPTEIKTTFLEASRSTNSVARPPGG